MNRDAMAIGAVLLCTTAFFVEGGAAPGSWTLTGWTPTAIASVLYLALIGTCLTFGVYFWLMRRMSASKLSLIAFANPCVALALGTLWGEPLTTWMVAGSAMVVAGVALVLQPARSRLRQEPQRERVEDREAPSAPLEGAQPSAAICE